MMSPEPDKQQGKAIDDYYDCRRRTTIQKQQLDIILPKDRWEIELFETDNISILLTLGRFQK